MRDLLNALEDLNRRIDDAIESEEVERLPSLLQARGKLLEKLNVDGLSEEERLFFQRMAEEDRRRVERIERLAEEYKDRAKRLLEGKTAMTRGYLNLQEADRVRKIDRSG